MIAKWRRLWALVMQPDPFLRPIRSRLLSRVTPVVGGCCQAGRRRILPWIAAVLLQLPVQPALAVVPGDRYRLGPGDALALRFLDPGAAELTGPLTILADGTATAALLGSVELSGLTLNQAQQLLRQLYGRYLRRPELTLAVVTPRPLRVTVLGEVERPGVYELPPLAGSAVAAIQAAGGATLQADLQSVVLQRAEGRAQPQPLDLAALLQRGDQRQNPLLLDGDTLRLGRLQLPAGTAMVEAVLAAGGTVPWRGRSAQAELVRVSRDGTTRREFITLRDQQNVSVAFNPPLQNNDTVIVHRTLYAKSLDVLNQVLVPLATVGNYWWLYRSYWP
jgi:polysaccharide export outer membrane protein